MHQFKTFQSVWCASVQFILFIDALIYLTLVLFPPADSRWVPDPSRGPIRARFQSRRRVRRRILILDQWLQKLPHLLAPRIRRVVVDREDADGAETTAVDDGRLTGQGAVAVDARVGAGGDDRAVAEEAGGGVVDCGVDLSAASHTCLDERWVDAVGVLEGGDFGVVDIDAVAQG